MIGKSGLWTTLILSLKSDMDNTRARDELLKPTRFLPGSREKLDLMRDRETAAVPLFHPNDVAVWDYDDGSSPTSIWNTNKLKNR